MARRKEAKVIRFGKIVEFLGGSEIESMHARLIACFRRDVEAGKADKR